MTQKRPSQPSQPSGGRFVKQYADGGSVEEEEDEYDDDYGDDDEDEFYRPLEPVSEKAIGKQAAKIQNEIIYEKNRQAAADSEAKINQLMSQIDPSHAIDKRLHAFVDNAPSKYVAIRSNPEAYSAFKSAPIESMSEEQLDDLYDSMTNLFSPFWQSIAKNKQKSGALSGNSVKKLVQYTDPKTGVTHLVDNPAKLRGLFAKALRSQR